MKSNRPPIPWREIRELVRYLEHEERHLRDNPHPAHIGHAVRAVREWLNPKRQPPDPNQMTMIGRW
jgi:hypothetical protein